MSYEYISYVPIIVISVFQKSSFVFILPPLLHMKMPFT